MPEEEKKKEHSQTREESARPGPRHKKAEEENGAIPVVGIGASAGGLDPLEHFFQKVPVDSGIAFVVVQHLDPRHKSVMASLLERKSSLKATQVVDGTALVPNHIYLKPPESHVVIKDHTLFLEPLQKNKDNRFPIDKFFRSLAKDQKGKAVCIILSGAGNDGTQGARYIKEAGGVVLVQAEEEAQYPQMPRSAIDAGTADFILPVEEMPERLVDLSKAALWPEPEPHLKEDAVQRNLKSILFMVRNHSGHDFFNYKQNTVLRRVRRRMAIQNIQDMRDYRIFLGRNPEELNRLFKDLTIQVTRFFRDPRAFESLRALALEPFLEKRNSDEPLRVWVPGCATGEEAYSLGMLITEVMDDLEPKPRQKFKIFASDIEADAIEVGRQGLYPETLLADLSKERINRFFTRKNNKYAVKNDLRETVVFTVHDLIRDPPFSNIDLISCRNVLIYMNSDLQQQVLQIFHYSLKTDGILFLGTSEMASNAERNFKPADKKNKIYRRDHTGPVPIPSFRLPDYGQSSQNHPGPNPRPAENPPGSQNVAEARQMVEQSLLETYSSPAVLINETGDILYLHGEAGRYLSMPAGAPVYNIFKMVRGELHNRIRAGVDAVKEAWEPVHIKEIHMVQEERLLRLSLSLRPVFGKNRNLHILLEFKEKPSEENPDHNRKPKEINKLAELRRELSSTRQELQGHH